MRILCHCCALLSLLLVFTGCPNTQQIRHKTFKTTEQLFQAIRKERSQIKSLEGGAKLRIYRPGKRRRTIRVFFQIKRPNQLHLQIRAVAMQPFAIITCDGKTFSIHYVTQGQFVTGPAKRLPQYLGEYLPSDISLAQLIATLLGEPPILPHKQIVAKQQINQLHMTLTHPKHGQQVWVDLAKQQYTKTIVTPKGRDPLTLEYGTYRGTPPLPKRVKFIMKKGKQRVHWIFSEPAINPTIKASAFRQTPPKGAKVTKVN